MSACAERNRLFGISAVRLGFLTDDGLTAWLADPCRTGVCQTCECGLISGSVKYDPEPLGPAADGDLLSCCSRPQEDVVLDIWSRPVWAANIRLD
jgi:hypothetical protein